MRLSGTAAVCRILLYLSKPVTVAAAGCLEDLLLLTLPQSAVLLLFGAMLPGLFPAAKR